MDNLKKAYIVKEQALREEQLRTASLQRELGDVKLEMEELKRSPRAPGSITPRTSIRVSKLQAVARGFLHRMRQHRTRVHHAALSAGVLFAMKNTVQGMFYLIKCIIHLVLNLTYNVIFSGETGWYCAPDGSIYYFVLEEVS